MDTSALQRFSAEKIGMFYHFGLYTLLGGNENAVRGTTGKEAYRTLMRKFAAKRFDADAWVACAASMGARYIVPTAKHAEGFCLWDSKLTELKSTRTPFGRDLIAELAAAAKRQGVPFAFYYNLETWLNEGDDLWNRQGLSYADFIEGQLTELLTDYGPVALIWFDHAHPDVPFARMQQILATIKRLQPDCLVNNRGSEPALGDFLTPERQIPDSDGTRRHVIECCDAMGVKSWGYHRQESFWSTDELAKRVSLCASKGYNYLLNVEPAPDGSIRRECRVRAQGLGAWIGRNQPALLADPSALVPVDPNILHQPALGVATLADNTLFLHLHQWPVADEVRVRVVGEPLRAELTGSRARLKASADGEGVRVRGMPPTPPAGVAPWIVALELKTPPRALPAVPAAIPEYLAGESIFLAPQTAGRSTANGVLVPAINRFANGHISMGSLHKIGDTLTWRVKVAVAGEFEVQAAFGSITCQDNAGFELACGTSVIHGRTWLTEHYSQPVRRAIGHLQMAQGENTITLRVTEVPSGAFSDVHGLTLIPASSGNAPRFPVNRYRGYRRHDFQISEHGAILVEPNDPAPGRRWIWRAEFFDAFPGLDLALLERGWWLAYLNVGNTFGCPSAMRRFDAFYRELTEKHGFHARPVLEGLSRGGLYVYNWAAEHADHVGLILADNPVCDFKSWPGGRGKGPGSAADWASLLHGYGFASEAEALAWKKNPVDNLAPLVKAGIPLVHLFGDADEVVPWEENTGVVAERVAALGGTIKLIRKPGCKHHPHGPDDPAALADWILQHALA